MKIRVVYLTILTGPLGRFLVFVSRATRMGLDLRLMHRDEKISVQSFLEGPQRLGLWWLFAIVEYGCDLLAHGMPLM